VTTYSNELIARDFLSRAARELPRSEFFGGLFTLGCLSGLASRIVQSVNQLGWADALFSSFGVSVAVWISCAAGISLVLRDRTIGVLPSELAIGVGFVLLVILPIGPLSWLAVAGLSLYIIIFTNIASSRRGAFILLAATVPMLWSRLLFQFFANAILRIDASLVGWILGTHRTGDIVEFADGSGVLVILPGCSSLANVSLAILCWVTVSQLVDHKKSAYDLVWCLMACLSVVAVNVTRISLMGLSQWHYATFHSPWSDVLGNTIILSLIVGFSVLGVRREFFRRL
jgi:exosortase/archaeosortase family protein